LNGAAFAVIGAISGGLLTALSALALSYYQRSNAQRDAHLLRAFEKHFSEYEGIFVTCRSTIDALNDYLTVKAKAKRGDDPFLFQLLDILKNSAYEYCIAVDWRHNRAMAYLDLALEEKCLHMRDLLLAWLSVSRITTGDIVSIRRGEEISFVPVSKALLLSPPDYRELIVESLPIVVAGPNDSKLASDIRASATSIIKELRAVMAY
jgi:hypothetical protein